jgi:hypothetical protein
VDQSIEQMSQDLARAGYAKSTQERYVATAKELGARFGKPIRDLSRDEVREFVDAVVAKGQGFSTTNKQLSAVMFLFRKTLGPTVPVSVTVTMSPMPGEASSMTRKAEVAVRAARK